MIALALGQKGSGKSRLLRSIAAARLARFPKCSFIVHDPAAQWQGSIFSTCGDARRYMAERKVQPRVTVIRADTADAVCRLAWDTGNTTCVIDELDAVCTAKRWSQEERLDSVNCGAARALAHYGRHRGVDLFGSFRFTRNVNEDLPALADFVFLLRHSAAAAYDIRTIRLRFGDAYADEVIAMAPHETLIWHDGVATPTT